MASPIIVGRVPLLLVLTSALLVAAHGFTFNDVLSLSASSVELSSIDETPWPDSEDSSNVSEPKDPSYVSEPEDSSYVSSDFVNESSLSSDDVSSSSISSIMDLSELDEQSLPDPHDPSYDPPDDYESSLSSDDITDSIDDSPRHPYDLRKITHGAGKKKRLPTSLESKQPEENPNQDNAGMRKFGRPPAVFNGPREDSDATRRDGPGRRVIPDRDGDGTGSGKPVRGGSRPPPDKGKPSKSPDRRWDGPPSPQRVKEMRSADTKYLDLYLCGQFLLGSAGAIADDFAVVSFNYAGRTQPFSPCSALGTTTETLNYIYRTPREDASAFQQVVDDLPATWQRYLAEKGVAPRIVHVFTYNMPSSVADASSLLSLRSSAPYRSALFVLGYVNQSSPDDLLESDSAQGFIDLLGALERTRIETIRVCGRCVKAVSSSGRRRTAMQYGMSVISEDSEKSRCDPLQELGIPGAEFTSNTCDSFQKSIIRCALRTIQRRCPEIDSDTPSSAGDTDEALLEAVNDIAKVCIGDSECWRREGESIRQFIVPKSENRCNMPEDALGKMLGRCSAAATGRGLPFDV